MTLWRLLERYHVPTFIYVNKMDLPGADKALRLRELRGRFGDGCVDFTPTVPAEERAEALGVCSEPLMEAVLATGTVPQADLITAITRRQVFPCYFGAALRLDGIDDLLNGLQRDTRMPPGRRQLWRAHLQDRGRRIRRAHDLPESDGRRAESQIQPGVPPRCPCGV